MLGRLRRITRDGRWIPEIDGLRFVAIASVFLFHLAGEVAHRSGRELPAEPAFFWLSRLLGNGDRGVAVFFVLSGMILALPFARQYLLGARPVSLRKYYLRRVTRLEPPYLAAVLLGTAMLLVYLHGPVPHLWPHVLASLLYQHTLLYGSASWVNSVSWSLEVEIQFYVLAPLMIQVFRIPSKTLRRGALAAAIGAAGLLQVPFADGPRFGASLLFYLQYFLAGLLLADVFVLERESMRTSLLWDVLGSVALGAIFWAPHDAYWPHAWMPLPIAVLCVAAFQSIVLRRVLTTPVLAIAGGMCYSIYLLHYLFIAVVFKVTRRAVLTGVSFPANLALQLVITGLPVLLLCTAFYVLVERPCMDPDWPSRLWRRLTGRDSSVAEALDTAGVSEERTPPSDEPPKLARGDTVS